ncbi:competence type IV pilus major pilin ComGC [Alkalibacterium putridalgicola]|uniref:competence type IV pilus major pilin ComGC n=1 Tax=Alkalibacterium putridalgicola TaxID=426703 RepID=UPI0034CDC271
MRNKIKQMMQKEEGFTLVELLAVIVILGVIVAIAIPSIGNVISNAEKSSSEAEWALIEDAGRLYDIEVGMKATTEGGTPSVAVSELIEKGFLDLREEDTENPTATDGTVTKERIVADDSTSGFKYVYSGRTP